jgi:hypothetical protein
VKSIPRSWLYLGVALVAGLVLTRVRVRPLSVLGVVLVVGAALYAGNVLLHRARRGGGIAPPASTARALEPAPPGPGPALDSPMARTFLQEHTRRLARVAAGCLGLAAVLGAAAVAALLLHEPGGRPGWPAVLLAIACVLAVAVAVAALAGLAQCRRARRALRRSPWRAVSAQGRVRRGRAVRGPATVRELSPVRLGMGTGDPLMVGLRAFPFAPDDEAAAPVSADGHRATAWYVGDDLGNGLLAAPGGGSLLRTRAQTR